MMIYVNENTILIIFLKINVNCIKIYIIVNTCFFFPNLIKFVQEFNNYSYIKN